MTVARLPLREVVAASDWVVLALVRSLSGEGRDRRARAEVLEAWKGTPPAEVEFSACPSWMCDISGAEPGETAVFFLAADGSGPHRIAHAGRGRMPVRTVGAERYATVWDDVVLPPGTAMVEGPDPEYPFIRSVALKALKGLVLRTAAAEDAPK